MKSYLVTWQIDIEAETPREAAEQARAIQLNPDSWANVFTAQAHKDTKLHTIDLSEEETEDNIVERAFQQ